MKKHHLAHAAKVYFGIGALYAAYNAFQSATERTPSEIALNLTVWPVRMWNNRNA